MRGSRATRRFASALALAIALSLAGAPAALAHKEHAVGPLRISVGFATEPAFESEPNAVEVTVTRGGEPVTSRVRLEAEVVFGDASTTMPLEPGEPGTYLAGFIPTRPGEYTFHVTGRADGRRVEVETTSGPETFSDVLARSEASFPAADPSTGELADLIERQTGRLGEDLAAATEAAEERAASARTLALIALAIGTLALIAAVGLASLSLRRSRG